MAAKKMAGSTADNKYAKIDAIIEHYVKQGNFNGVVAVGESDSLTFNKAYGLANRQLGVKNDTDTRFEVGSMSKQFCAMLVLMAESEGKIVLDSPVGYYLPYTQMASSGFSGVTIHQLLAMRSGIPSYDNFPNFLYGVARKNFTHQEFIMDQCAYPIAPPPGIMFGYCDGNYYILGAILEKIYRMSYDSLLSQKIFKPLNMTNSGFLKHSGYPNGGDVVPNLNNGYQPITNVYDSITGLPITTVYQNAAWTNMSDIAYASGAVYMTGSDFIKWSFALENNTLLPAKYTQKMFTSYSDTGVLQNYYPNKPGCLPTGYGFAYVIVHRRIPPDSSCATIYTHGGLAPGYSSVGTILKGQHMSIFISSNINSDAPLFMCWQIMNTLLGAKNPNYGGIP